MPIGLVSAGVAAAGAVGGALISSSASKKASQTQAAGADAATNLQRDIYTQNRADMAPWREKGASALSMLADSLGISGPEGNARATGAFQASPGYDFAFEQGKRGVEGSLAAKSMSRSGAAAKQLTRFGQGTADQEYGGWLSRLGQLAGFGGQANQTGAQSANAYATGASNSIQNAAYQRASGYEGSASAMTGGLNQLGQLATQYGGSFGRGSTITPAMSTFGPDWVGG